MTPPIPQHPVLQAAQRFRAQLLANEQAAANRLTQAYGRAYGRLQTNIEALEQALSALPDPDRTSIMRLAALRSLKAQVVDELNRFSVYADTEISNAATQSIAQGLQDSRALVQAYFGPQQQQVIAARFDMLAVEQAEVAMGFLADDSPLHDALVRKLGPAVAERMGNAIVEGILLGMNPREIARIARQEMGVGLTWALTTARTAQLYSYRGASHLNYQANRDIVAGWVWFADLSSPRTCMSCIAQHGTEHSVDEVLTDHHAGRCSPIPLVPLARRLGIAPPEIQRGEDWFRAQPEDAQVKRMGGGMWDAWKAGQVQFADLSQKYSDPVYGEMLREASLKGLLGEKAERFYRR